MSEPTEKSLGQSIDAIIDSLNGLDSSSQLIAVKAVCEHFKITLEKEVKPIEHPDEQLKQQDKPIKQQDRPNLTRI